VWADRESQLSLLGRTFTASDREFNLFLLLDWVGEFIYGLVTEIPSQRIAQLFKVQ